MEGGLEEALEIADEKIEIRINNRKEKSRCLRSYCKDLDLNLISSGIDDFTKSFEITIYIVKANGLREGTFFGKISMEFYSLTCDIKNIKGVFISSCSIFICWLYLKEGRCSLYSFEEQSRSYHPR